MNETCRTLSLPLFFCYCCCCCCCCMFTVHSTTIEYFAFIFILCRFSIPWYFQFNFFGFAIVDVVHHSFKKWWNRFIWIKKNESQSSMKWSILPSSLSFVFYFDTRSLFDAYTEFDALLHIQSNAQKRMQNWLARQKIETRRSRHKTTTKRGVYTRMQFIFSIERESEGKREREREKGR